VSGVTAKSIVYISSSFLHEMDKRESSGVLPFFTENQAYLTTGCSEGSASDDR